MDRVEQAVVRQCLRQMLGEGTDKIGLHEDVVNMLLSKDSMKQRTEAPITLKEVADNYLYTRSVKQRMQSDISEAGLDVLADHTPKLVDFYGKTNRNILVFLSSIMEKNRNMPPIYEEDSASTAKGKMRCIDIIFENWSRSSKKDHGSLRSGIYQIFRRHKPTRAQKLARNPTHDWSIDDNHAVVCELLYLDFKRLECRMVTGDLNVYHGSMCITHEDILYIILQRSSLNGIDIHQRYIASKIEKTDFDMYMGLCVKIGNVSIRPVTAGFFYVFIPPESDQNLYSEFEPIIAREWGDNSPISSDSVVADYIAITPPRHPRSHPDWKKVRYVKDFPALRKMANPTDDYIALFREPLRTLASDTLGNVLIDEPLTVFQQSLPRSEKA